MSEDREQWADAIRKEIFALLEETKTFVREDIDTSKPYTLINTTMQLKKKMNDAVTLDQYKARCCGCGNEIKDVTAESFSPTVSRMAHSAVHQIAVRDGMKTLQA